MARDHVAVRTVEQAANKCEIILMDLGRAMAAARLVIQRSNGRARARGNLLGYFGYFNWLWACYIVERGRTWMVPV